SLVMLMMFRSLSILIAGCAWLAALCFVIAPAHGAPEPAPVRPAASVRAAVLRPFAPRGTALAIPAVIHAGARIPDQLQLVLDDGRRLEARLAAISTRPAALTRQWSEDARQLKLTALRPGDIPPANSRLLILAPLPADATGSIRFGDQVLTPIWLDVPAPTTTPAAGTPMPMTARDDRPDAASPFEYWRWVLLADRLGERPPEANYPDPVARLWARHEAGLWSAGLARLAGPHPGIANACRDLLTQTCSDGDHDFAAWIADPALISELLELLLDQTRDIGRISRDALAWSDGIDPIFLWPEDDGAAYVRLAIVNPGPEPTTAQMQWDRERDQAPLAYEVAARSLGSVRIRRPDLPERGPVDTQADPATEPETLFVTINGREHRVTFAPRRIELHPPGLYVMPFRPPLTLGEVRSRRQRDVPASHQTGAHLRRAMRRWEIFIECERPLAARPTGERSLERLREPMDIEQLETVTVELIAPSFDDADSMNRTVLTVPETGWHRIFTGAQDGTLRIHRSAAGTELPRWSCRIVLPEAWLSPAPAFPTQIRIWRSHADHGGIESTSLPTAPWRSATSSLSVDLTQWPDLPARTTMDINR
ncbi:MAG: hypothetical protein KC983_07725, partial [Phycisphaerales bacterium]|nr:hypothetical protein [Phycisphaerales bacterium]